jgi:hypothetical protein
MTTKIFVSQIDKTNPDGYTGSTGAFLILGSAGPYWASGDAAAPVGFLGSIGFQGSSGFQGSFGVTGFQGSLGYVGYTGSIGFQGSSGFLGSAGFQGSLGDTGYKGSFGDLGYRGSQGVIGDQGPVGYQGSTSFAGSVGFQGSAGPPGPINIGFQGSLGDTGYQGSAGFLGSAGFIGSAGFNGSTGFLGSTGFAGSVGYGLTGYTGSVGAIGGLGPFGYQGSAGFMGSVPSISLTNLLDFPASYTSPNAFLKVNAAATGIVFDTNTYITNAVSTNLSMNYNTLFNPILSGYGEVVNQIGNATVAGFGFTPNANGNIVSVTLTDSVVGITIGNTGMTTGKLYTVTMFVKQDATGNRTIDWSALNIKWPTGESTPATGPLLSIQPNYTDVITLYTLNAGTTWYGILAIKGFSG